MASAAVVVVNNLAVAALSPDPHFLDCPQPPSPSPAPYGWLSPSRISFTRDLPPTDDSATTGDERHPGPDSTGKDIVFDFEFRLHDPVSMLPADELFSDGKLMPLQLATAKHAADGPAAGIQPPDSLKTRRMVEIPAPDPYVFSPRAPRCTTVWRELLGLKRPQSPKPADTQKSPSAAAAAAAASATAARSPNQRYLRNLLHRSAKPASPDSALRLPLRDSDAESLSISTRLSLSSSSSSSSGPDHEDLPRLLLEADHKAPACPPVRLIRPRTSTSDGGPRLAPASRAGRSPIRRSRELSAPPIGVNVDSPRMNPSGKIVFQGLERSSSSPGSFTGGPRPRSRGMERSYSAHVRVAPVLSVVPVCSLRGSAKSVFGLGQMFSPQKKDKEAPAPAPAQNVSNRPETTPNGSNRSGTSKTKTTSGRTPREQQA